MTGVVLAMLPVDFLAFFKLRGVGKSSQKVPNIVKGPKSQDVDVLAAHSLR